jgi:hypothetical protein
LGLEAFINICKITVPQKKGGNYFYTGVTFLSHWNYYKFEADTDR